MSEITNCPFCNSKLKPKKFIKSPYVSYKECIDAVDKSHYFHIKQCSSTLQVFYGSIFIKNLKLLFNKEKSFIYESNDDGRYDFPKLLLEIGPINLDLSVPIDTDTFYKKLVAYITFS